MALNEIQTIILQDSENGDGFFYINWFKSESVIHSTNINKDDPQDSQANVYPAKTFVRTDMYDFYASESVSDVLDYMQTNGLTF